MRTVTLEYAYQTAKIKLYRKQWLYLWDLVQKAEIEHIGTFCREIRVSYQAFNTWERLDIQPSIVVVNRIIEYFSSKGIMADFNKLRHNPAYLKREIRHQEQRIKDAGNILIRGEILSINDEDQESTSKH